MIRQRLYLLGLLVTTGACGGSDPEPPTGPDPATNAGFLNVRLTTPNTDDGAILFTLGGGTMDSLSAAGFTLLSGASGASTVVAVVAGDITSGIVARFWVPDLDQAGAYTATLQQAAVRGTYAQRDIALYALAVEP